jgi:hypothetical protein
MTLRVTSEHLRGVPGFNPKPGFCVTGGRAWFARHGARLGCTWRQFLREGIEAERLERIGDTFALAIVAHAREEAARGR